MTKERLEELIKQKEWIWIVDDEQKCFGLKLDNRLHIKDNSLRSELETVYATLNNIFETKEQAEWALKMVAERTERFEPPMWEEIKDKYSFGFMNCKSSVVRFSVFKKYNLLNHIVVYSCDNDDYIYRDISTKENYEKACEIVRDLFKGESNGKEEVK